MKALLRHSFLATTLVLGCGGTAVVEGGEGGFGATSTNQATTTSSQSSASNMSSSVDSAVSTATTTVTSSASTMTSSVTGPGGCDFSGYCGENGGGCIECALGGNCAGIYNECIAETECIDYSDCINSCGGDPGCGDKCSMVYPKGAELYNALIECVICIECANDCMGFATCGAPPNP